MKKVIKQISILAAISIIIGVLFNGLRSDGIPLIGSWPSSGSADVAVPPSAEEGDPPFVSLDEAAALYQTPGVLFIDARDPEDYVLNHIKGSISIPYEYLPDENIDDYWAEFAARIPYDRRIVIYCSGTECELSLFLGREMAQRGYSDIKIFYGGWSEWEKAALPIEKGEKLVGPE